MNPMEYISCRLFIETFCSKQFMSIELWLRQKSPRMHAGLWRSCKLMQNIKDRNNSFWKLFQNMLILHFKVFLVPSLLLEPGAEHICQRASNSTKSSRWCHIAERGSSAVPFCFLVTIRHDPFMHTVPQEAPL